MSEMFEFALLEVPLIENRLEPGKARLLMGSLAALILSQRFEVFGTQGRGMSPAWAPLAPSTMQRRLAKVPARKRNRQNAVMILQDSGKLRGSFTPATPGAQQPTADGTMTVTQEEAHLESHVPYAAIHNFGGTIQHPGSRDGFGRGIKIPAHQITIPARPFDQFRESDREEIQHLVEEFIDG